jgi:uncharacterized membrane protein YadS
VLGLGLKDMSEAAIPIRAAAPPRLSEDIVAVGLGLGVLLLALLSLFGADALGWLATTSVWTDPSSALAPASKAYGALGGVGSLLVTYLVLAAVLSASAYLLGQDVRQFALAFTAVFAIAYASWFIGSSAYLAAVTPADQAKFGVSWSLKLTNEGGFIVALLAGLVIANVFPAFAEQLKIAARPELYIKIAIVILGASIAVTVASKLTLASSLMLRGLAAIVEAYLIYWPIVYLIARKGFGFSREWAAPLASGVSICGVAAAIATGGAIRGRPAVPVLVSSLVVVFAVIEVLILPPIAQTFMSHEPLVAAAWMGLAVKTDGAALAAGGITQSLIQAKAAAEGIAYQPGWMLAVTASVKVFIDVFIGVWAFILAYIWTNHINPRAGAPKARLAEIWERFPKFILGFVATFVLALALALGTTAGSSGKLAAAIGEANVLRVIFFVLTFFSIGLMSNFRQLWQDGFAKLAAVYLVSLFGFVVWVGFVISWLFFAGVKPPLAS